MSEMRKKFIPDWAPEREDFPDGIRQLLHDEEQLTRSPAEERDWQRSLVPGDEYPSLHKENPYSCMMPGALRALMENPYVPDEDKKLAREAYLRLKELEDGKAGPSGDVPPPRPKFRQI